jgi:hypothetical protein
MQFTGFDLPAFGCQIREPIAVLSGAFSSSAGHAGDDRESKCCVPRTRPFDNAIRRAYT